MALREAILAALVHRPMTGYEIAKDFDQVFAHFWQASHQQIYRELARLSDDGHVVFRVVPQKGKPDKKVYALTAAGRAKLKQWLAEPTEVPKPRAAVLVKLLAGMAIDRPALRQEIARVRQGMRMYLQQLREIRRLCLGQPLESLSDRDSALYLALRRGLLTVQANIEWLDEVSEFLENGHLKR
jgi:PadR family transcriptional regulator AphA